MSVSMYDVTVPPMRHMLKSLKAVLAKAEAHCTARKIEPDALLTFRLYPDMLPFVRQIQIASDNAKGAAARLGGVDVPSYSDTEATFAELHERIQKTLDFMQSVPQAGFDGSESRHIVLKFPSSTFEFDGLNYLTGFVLPNFFFHVTTAYAILRHCGVPLGKTDFLGG